MQGEAAIEAKTKLQDSARATVRTGIAILAAGALSASLDLAYAFLWHTRVFGVTPLRILESIASGLVGRAAFSGGWAAGLLGLVAHYAILIGAAAIYVVASRYWNLLLRRPLLAGLAFGAGIYLSMHYVIVPLSAAPHFGSGPPGQAALDIAVHTLVLGPAISLVLARCLGPGRQ